jgi:hypothetical protein
MNVGEGDWASKLSNLKKLVNALDEFYTASLDKPIDGIVEDLDLTAIARNDDRRELMRLIELVLGAAVQCNAKETYIGRIMTMDEADQAQLMPVIQ